MGGINRVHTFIQGYNQVFFVALNTVFITLEAYILVFITSYAISHLWTHNVRKAIFGSELDRIIYALGAACGGVSGLFLAKTIGLFVTRLLS